MSQTSQNTYPISDLLVTTEWLSKHLDDPPIRIIDCDPPEVAFTRDHIPGAVALGIHPYFRNLETGLGVATAEQAERVLRQLGVSNTTRVICYDSQGGLLAARVWWALWYHGHEHVALLNGGWPAWLEAGLPVTRDWATPAPGTFTASTHPERIASCDVMLPWVDSDDFIPLDVRSYAEWSGNPPTSSNRREGHIPGAVHLEWREFVDWERATKLKTAPELQALLESKGITRDKRVVPY